MKKEIKTKSNLIKVLEHLPFEDDAQEKNAICSLIGRSRIQTHCFGYYNCGRCGDQLGDTLGSIYRGAEDAVIVGRACAKCLANYKKCDWKDKYLAPNPFPKKE